MMFVTQLRQKDCKDMNDIWHREKLKEYFYPEKSTISVRVLCNKIHAGEDADVRYSRISVTQFNEKLKGNQQSTTY